jgi:hypothetical protein
MRSAQHHDHSHRITRLGRLPRWQRIATHAIFGFCALSGLLFFMAHDIHLELSGMRSHSLLVAHGMSAALALMAFGAVMPAHIRVAWRARRNRTTGIMLSTLLIALVISGLLLYYGSEDIRQAIVWSHWVMGGLGMMLFPLHFVWGQRATASPPSPRSPRAQSQSPT